MARLRPGGRRAHTEAGSVSASRMRGTAKRCCSDSGAPDRRLAGGQARGARRRGGSRWSSGIGCDIGSTSSIGACCTAATASRMTPSSPSMRSSSASLRSIRARPARCATSSRVSRPCVRQSMGTAAAPSPVPRRGGEHPRRFPAGHGLGVGDEAVQRRGELLRVAELGGLTEHDQPASGQVREAGLERGQAPNRHEVADLQGHEVPVAPSVERCREVEPDDALDLVPGHEHVVDGHALTGQQQVRARAGVPPAQPDETVGGDHQEDGDPDPHRPGARGPLGQRPHDEPHEQEQEERQPGQADEPLGGPPHRDPDPVLDDNRYPDDRVSGLLLQDRVAPVRPRHDLAPAVIAAGAGYPLDHRRLLDRASTVRRLPERVLPGMRAQAGTDTAPRRCRSVVPAVGRGLLSGARSAPSRSTPRWRVAQRALLGGQLRATEGTEPGPALHPSPTGPGGPRDPDPSRELGRDLVPGLPSEFAGAVQPPSWPSSWPSGCSSRRCASGPTPTTTPSRAPCARSSGGWTDAGRRNDRAGLSKPGGAVRGRGEAARTAAAPTRRSSRHDHHQLRRPANPLRHRP